EAGQGHADLRQVAHEDAGEIDQVAPLRAFRGDGKAEQDAVGISLADRAGFRGTLVRLEADIPADDVDVLIHFAELPDPVVAKTPAHAAQELPLGNAAGD